MNKQFRSKIKVEYGPKSVGNILDSYSQIFESDKRPDAVEFAVKHAIEIKKSVLRIKYLLALYESDIQLSSDDGVVYKTDILRASIVLAHASLEGFLRSIIIQLADHASPKWMKDIPIVGRNKTSNLKLGVLGQHRGKTVNDLIEESIDEYIMGGKLNFSHRGKLKEFLDEFGIDKKPVLKFLPKIDKMIQRRHSIAHNADIRKDQKGLKPINTQTVNVWLDATIQFMSHVLALATIKKYPTLVSEV